MAATPLRGRGSGCSIIAFYDDAFEMVKIFLENHGVALAVSEFASCAALLEPESPMRHWQFAIVPTHIYNSGHDHHTTGDVESSRLGKAR